MDRPNILILFTSKYGSTERYASWLHQHVESDICELDDFDPHDLQRYQTIVFGAPIRMGLIQQTGFISQHWPQLSGKRVIVFAVGAEPPGSPERAQELQNSLPASIRSHIAYFPLWGAFDYNRLTLWDKVLMAGPRLALLRQWWLQGDSKAKQRLDNWYQPQDWTNKTSILPIIALIKPHHSAPDLPISIAAV